MSIHKLSAGSGYDYLTRQVAAMDGTEKGHTSLASYYTESGETPGQWIGSGLTGIEGLEAGDVVTAEQMKALFGYGFHPLADERLAALEVTAGPAEVCKAQRLGTPYKVYEADVPPYRIEVARRLEDLNLAAGRPRDAVASVDERAQVRTEVAREYFEREHGRAPDNPRELASAIALHSRPKTTAVAGYDLTFSPVKSVSALWAVADTSTAATIERAHNAAVKDALMFIEREALYTRLGTNGVRQVDVHGLVATAFTHRDSRAGDPDLHTHVAVANKVQAVEDGRWRAIDGRLMFKATVAASEVYNTALERHLSSSLGVRFEERPGVDQRKRPVREIVGVDPRLNARWSTRRQSIERRRDDLVATFQAEHGRPPTPVETFQLAQQATLETREAKHEPRSLVEQRTVWHAEAVEVLGGVRGVDAMVRTATAPPVVDAAQAAGRRVDAAWVSTAADRVLDQVQTRRSTWQRWHLVAEAQRQARRGDVTAEQIPALVGLIVEEATSRSMLIKSDQDSIDEPAELRRLDGQSKYAVAGSDLYTSTEILAAEQRLVAAAGRHDGRRIAPETVELALLESAANGVELNAGQAAMVRGMATSGARVQVGIAAAGTGKTTAMQVLARAWEEGGGTVIGLAPSAAAAAALGDSIGTSTDTLAKLVDDLDRGASPGMVDAIGPGTMVVIDEAGMADTLSLDVAIAGVLQRGGSVRLIGDDQQLAAIGAGGVLRDIIATHGAQRLSELMRFSDPAEGAATIALRAGLPEALGYYFDQQRVHVGDLATSTDGVFDGWLTDRSQGKDAIMLAPTRDLVADLNARARTARIIAGEVDPARAVRLADGSTASVGDVVLTRQNDRRLRLSPTDWVKNGDRWIVTEAGRGALGVRHLESGLNITLPATYVAQNTELGYASTVHAAQGLTADTMHGLVIGEESRQQFYTMMTRGRHENHAHLVVAADGDPHSLIRPESIRQASAAEILEGVLARDESPKSATTIAHEAADPAVQLNAATDRYVDALYVAAETVIGVETVAGIDNGAKVLVPGIADEAAWPALRSHLLLLQAQGADAVGVLADAVAEREVESADDRAAVLDWRLDPTGRRGAPTGPLSWVPGIPGRIAADPVWGPYLAGRSARVEALALAVRDGATAGDSPAWARQTRISPTSGLAGDVAVWRAATGVDETDRRPTGPRQQQKAQVLHQRDLDRRLNAGRSPAMDEWGALIHRLHPRLDTFTPLLAERLAAISRSGVNAADLLERAAGEGPLPDEHVAAALWWRIARHLSPAVATEQATSDGHVSAPWSGLLLEHLGAEAAGQVTESPWWPTLVATVDRAPARGWAVEQLLDLAKTSDVDDVDLAQAMIWRIGIVTDPPPLEDEPTPDEHLPPEGIDDLFPLDELAPPVAVTDRTDPVDALADVARNRDLLGPLEPADTDFWRQFDRVMEVQSSPVPIDRLRAINEAAADYFKQQFTGSWARTYLHERLGLDLAGDQRFRPGYAPAGWTNLVDHLRTQGFTDTEMVAAGVAKTASTGRLIDRFRDRAVLPVISDGQILGFVGRRNPTATSDKAGPKYLNTPDTVLFHKGAQLYGIGDEHMMTGAIPVVVEGPLDAIAVTISSASAFVGVAPLGTSMTEEQAAQLAQFGADPVIATDGDLAGRIAAERAMWLLAPQQLTAQLSPIPAGDDPANLLENKGAAQLVALLQQPTVLARTLVDERLANITDHAAALTGAAEVIAALPARDWENLIDHAAQGDDNTAAELRGHVATAAARFNDDPRGYSTDQLARVSDVRQRLEGHKHAAVADRWAPLGRQLDARLTACRDWPATAALLQELHEQGHDVTRLSQQLVANDPLEPAPARDLRYRLAERLTIEPSSLSRSSTVPTTQRPNPGAGPMTRPKHGQDRGPRR